MDIDIIEISEIFFGLYPECEEKEGIFEMV